MVEIKPIKANIPNWADQLNKAVQQAVQEEAKNIKREFEATTRTWRHKPTFIIDHNATEPNVYTFDKIYAYVSGGTRPRTIKPRKAKLLRFNSVFRAKSVPNKLTARAGFSGPPVAFRKEVKHPGIKARHFDKLIQGRSQGRFIRLIERRIRERVK